MIGVLALQGAFARHVEALERCGAEAMEVRKPDQLEQCRALIVPGGESTTMAKLLLTFDLDRPLRRRLAESMPVFGTCAGMIMLARGVSDGRPDQYSYGAIDIDVRRNAYGRQIDSFETDLYIKELDEPERPFTAVFIRAPLVERAGAEVEILAEVDGHPVLCRQGRILVSSFHPELTDDDRLHRLFLDSIS
jgi:5'-phosphate synthase pdxT subunit